MSRTPRFPAAPLAVAAALALACPLALAQTAAPTAPGAASTVSPAEAIEAQRRELARQAAELQRQREQLDSLAAEVEAQKKPAADTDGGLKLRWAGYADLSFQRYDFYENLQDTKPEKRGRADLKRFVLAPHAELGRGWSFYSEIEFEHGGTGSTVEFEAEEAGEYETEIEKGGEIVLEQMYLQYAFSPALNVRIGELIVPVGMINSHHQPSEYFSVDRSLAETSLLPTVWHETGVQVLGTLGQARYQVLLVTALDSTGFSGSDFVAGGAQGKMEFKNASGLALAAQFEYAIQPGFTVGAALYSGDSAKNRPRRNLAGSARVDLAELHLRYERGPWTVRSQWLQGRVQNAAGITQANLNTYNGDVLGTSRTPVGSRAESFFVEAGVDALQLAGLAQHGRLDVFARYDDYDTHAGTSGSIARVPRYARQAKTVGLNYKPQPGVVFKAEYSRHTHDGTVGNQQDWLGLSAGFEF